MYMFHKLYFVHSFLYFHSVPFNPRTNIWLWHTWTSNHLKQLLAHCYLAEKSHGPSSPPLSSTSHLLGAFMVIILPFLIWGERCWLHTAQSLRLSSRTTCMSFSICPHLTETQSPLNVNSVHWLHRVKSLPIHCAPSKYQLVHSPDQECISPWWNPIWWFPKKLRCILDRQEHESSARGCLAPSAMVVFRAAYCSWDFQHQEIE